MNTTRLISTVAVLVAALAAATPAAAEAPSDLSPEADAARFYAGGTLEETAFSAKERPGRMQAEGAAGGICWGKELMRSKGTFPYVRRLYLYTVWCGSGNTITYRSSTVRTSHDAVCWTESGPFLAKTAGGANYSFVEVQTWAGVACHSPVYFLLFHDSLMMRVRYFPNGAFQTVAVD